MSSPFQQPSPAKATSTGASIHDLANETYDETADPDYTVGPGEEDSEPDSSDIHSAISDEDTSSSEVTVVDEKASPVAVLSESQTSLDEIEHTHHRFRRFIHEQEVPRKFLHVSIGFLTLWLYTRGVETSQIVAPLAVLGATVLALDVLRFQSRRFNRLYCKTVGFLMRESEVKAVNGIVWYILGCLISLTYAPKDVAVMSILLLSWCDTAASTVGRRFGYLTPKIARGKSLAGSLGAFFTGMAACYFFYGYLAPKYTQFNDTFLFSESASHLSIHSLAVMCGFIAALSEGIDIFEIDDNLTIPALSSIFLSTAIKMANRGTLTAAIAAATS